MTTTRHAHPVFNFIEVEIEEDSEDGPSVTSTVDGEILEHPYIIDGNGDSAIMRVANALLHAERHFFLEKGPFYHFRDKLAEAAEQGDLATLYRLAEARGYWRGMTEANKVFNKVFNKAVVLLATGLFFQRLCARPRPFLPDFRRGEK